MTAFPSVPSSPECIKRHPCLQMIHLWLNKVQIEFSPELQTKWLQIYPNTNMLRFISNVSEYKGSRNNKQTRQTEQIRANWGAVFCLTTVKKNSKKENHIDDVRLRCKIHVADTAMTCQLHKNTNKPLYCTVDISVGAVVSQCHFHSAVMSSW